MSDLAKYSVLFNVDVNEKNARRQLGNIDKSTNKTSKGFQRLSKVAKSAFALFIVTKAVKAISSVVAVTNELSTSLVNIELKSKQVFGEALSLVTAEAEKNATAMGLSNSQFINAATSIGDLLIPLRFSREEAAKMSTEVVNLSGALANWSTDSRTAADIADILQKAMLGEREQLKTLGISITEADIKTKLLEKGQAKLTGTALQNAKAQATLALLYEKSTDAQAAYAEGLFILNGLEDKRAGLIQNIREKTAQAFGASLAVVKKFVVEGLEVTNDALTRIGNNEWAIKTAGYVGGLLASFKQVGINIFNTGQVFAQSITNLGSAGAAALTGNFRLAKEILKNGDAIIADIKKSSKGLGEAYKDGQREAEEFARSIAEAAGKVKTSNPAAVLGDDADKATKAVRTLAEEIALLDKLFKNLIDEDVPWIPNPAAMAAEIQRVLQLELDKIDLSIAPPVVLDDSDIERSRKQQRILRKRNMTEEQKEEKKAQDEAINSLINSTKNATDSLIREDLRRKDAAIQAQRDKITFLGSLQEEATDEQLRIEQNRLEKLTEEREKAARRGQQIAALEITASNAVAAAKSIEAISKAFAEGGNVFTGIATTVALAASIAATVATLSNAFGSAPAFFEGTENTGRGNLDGRGGFAAVLHPSERVVPKKYNDLLGGVSNKDLPRLVKLGQLQERYKINSDVMNDGKNDSLKELKSLREEVRELKNVMSKNRTSISLDSDGFSASVMGWQERQNKLDRLK